MATYIVSRSTRGEHFQLHLGHAGPAAFRAYDKAEPEGGTITLTRCADGERQVLRWKSADRPQDFAWVSGRCPCVCATHGPVGCACPCPRHAATTGMR